MKTKFPFLNQSWNEKTHNKYVVTADTHLSNIDLTVLIFYKNKGTL